MAPRTTGQIAWLDLTVSDAPAIRDFYSSVVGWSVTPVSMGEYDDYCMIPSVGEAVAGVCHARGTNAGLPPVWLPYFLVDDVQASAAKVKEMGGEVITGPRSMSSHGEWCVIRDPAGAYAALMQPPAAS